MLRKVLLALVILLAVITASVYFFADRMLGSELVRSTFEQQLATRLGQPVHVGAIGASLFPRVAVKLQDVSIGQPAAVQLGEVRVVTGLRGLFSRTITDAEVIVSHSRVTLPLPVAVVPASSPSSPSSSPGFTVTSIRVISFRDIELVAGKQAVRVNLDAAIEGDRLDIARLTLDGKKTKIEGHGVLDSIASLRGRVDARADPLDLDETIAIASAFTAPSGLTPPPSAPVQKSRPATDEGDTIPMYITARVTAPSGQFATYTFQDLSSTVELVPGRVTLSRLSLRSFGGHFAGRIDAVTSGKVPSLRLNGKVNGLDVASVMKAAGSAEGITGKLVGGVNLSADGTDAAAVMSSAHGTIDAAITDGTIQHLDMVREIVLAFGKPSGAPPEGSGSAFSRLGGTFALANSTVTSDNLSLLSRDFTMRGNGKLRLDNGAIEGRADVTLSADLTAQAGTDLRRYAQEDGRVVVPVTISGTLSNPRVFVDVAAAMKRALGNELQRRTKSFLGGLFRKKGGS